MNKRGIKGFKVFNNDWTCRGKQYACPGTFEEDVIISICGQGMHFCKKAIDCFNYYKFDPDNKVAEVVAYGTVVEKDDKCCTDRLEIIREVPWQELLEIVNIGKGNTGMSNSGDCNSGCYNSGDCNSGDCNNGHRNTGDCNNGIFNTGRYNSGKRNSGCYNSGDCNSGDFNTCNYSSGCFNTVEQKIHLFNKESKWTYQDWLRSDARYLLTQIEGKESECMVEWWRSLNAHQKKIILAIPNFNKVIFKEITGIDVDKKS